MDRFTGMTVFVKVVDAGGFAAAARHFGMSAQMVSKHVQTLEEHLGARLLNRTTRRLSATEVGQHFYERCMRILSELEERWIASDFSEDASALTERLRTAVRAIAY